MDVHNSEYLFINHKKATLSLIKFRICYETCYRYDLIAFNICAIIEKLFDL